MSLTLLQEFTRRTGIRDGKVDAILIGQAALPKFRHGIELPRSPRQKLHDRMMTTIAPPLPPDLTMRAFSPHKWQFRYWSHFLGVDHAPGKVPDDEIRHMIDELIEGHHTDDMPHEQG